MSANNSIRKNDVSIKDDKQYSRVIGTAQTQGQDDYEDEGVEIEIDPNGHGDDVQTLDGDDGNYGAGGPDDNSTPKYLMDDVVTPPVRQGGNQSVYGKVATQSTTDRVRLGNNNEYDEDAFDNKKPNQSMKRGGNLNHSVKAKDLNKSGKAGGKDGKGKGQRNQPSNTADIFSSGPADRSGKYKQSAIDDIQTPKTPHNKEMTFDDDGKQEGYSNCSFLDKLRFVTRLVGSLLSFMNLMGLLLYAMKHQFSAWQLYDTFNAFVVLRIVLILVLTLFTLFKNLIRHKISEPEVAGHSTNAVVAYGLIMYLCYPFMLWFGFYRMYAVKDFPILIFINYCFEFFLQNIPLVFVQGTNNATLKHYYDPSQLNKYTLGLTIVSMFEIFLNAVLMVLEIIATNKMRNAATGKNVNLTKYEALSEEKRRIKNYRKTVIVSVVMFVAFVMVISIGSTKIPNRQCSFGQSIDRAVCVDCTDQNCLQCTDNKDVCAYCMRGTFANPDTGVCQQCDAVGICLTCGFDGICTKCSPGYRLHQGACYSCEQTEGCQACSANECVSCFPGFFLDENTKQCVKCSEVHPYCTKCTKSTCQECQSGISNLNNGTCSCNLATGWSIATKPVNTTIFNNLQSCSCVGDQSYVDTELRCLRCAQLIPNCDDCTSTSSYIYGQKYIGTPAVAPGQQPYLKCHDCGSSKYLDIELKSCLYCNTTIPYCDQCDKYGQGCTKCEVGSYLYQENLGQSFKCEQCKNSIAFCDECSTQDLCSKCSKGYKVAAEGDCVPV